MAPEKSRVISVIGANTAISQARKGKECRKTIQGTLQQETMSKRSD
jgi:hypothetical protein